MKPLLPTATERPLWLRVRFVRGLYRLGHPLPTFATAAAVVLFVGAPVKPARSRWCKSTAMKE